MKSRFNLLPEVSYEDKFYGVKLKDNPNLSKHISQQTQQNAAQQNQQNQTQMPN